MGEAETEVRIIGDIKPEATTRRNERRRPKAVVRNDEEAVGGTQKTAAILEFNSSSVHRNAAQNFATASQQL